jgi:hypothetical protein
MSIYPLGTFMAVHKCILAARSNAFAGKDLQN